MTLRRRRVLSPGFAVALAVFAALTCLSVYPLIWLVLNSFKTNSELFDTSWRLPEIWRWGNYAKAWNFGIARYLANSLIVTGASVVLTVGLSLAAAYALGVVRFRWRWLIYLVILGGSILPPAVSLFPLFRILASLRLYDTLAAMILPDVAFGLPFTVFLIRAYLSTIPYELYEAARLDGAGILQSFWHVYVPLCRPVLASTMLITAMRVWNEFIFALTFVESEGTKTLTVGIASLQAAVTTNWAVLMAGLVISILPIMLVFLALQRQFMGGLTQGAVK